VNKKSKHKANGLQGFLNFGIQGSVQDFTRALLKISSNTIKIVTLLQKLGDLIWDRQTVLTRTKAPHD